mmetsp:Transcript_19880/g.24273  ORF Transcript_19880/g.24273 Transcript_19880/m.24273 type:complete len:201 (-) Transcript_19880:1412-2014(-)
MARSKGSTSTVSNFAAALRQTFSDSRILCVGITQACFEGAMYSFVFMWTPAVSSRDLNSTPPFGLIFSTFMLCSMAGSQCFSICIKKGFSPEYILKVTLIVSAISLSLGPVDSIIGTNWQYPGFLLFEVCVGFYFPSMGTLKGKVVPDDNRATIYNIFRIPLNIVVLVVLLGKFSVQTTFLLCTLLLSFAACLQLFVATI